MRGSGKVIREDMTARNNTTLFVARKSSAVENAWCQNGKLLVKLKQGGIKQITTCEDVYKLNHDDNVDEHT